MIDVKMVVNEKDSSAAAFVLAAAESSSIITSFNYVDEIGDKYCILNDSWTQAQYAFIKNPETDMNRYMLSRVYWPDYDLMDANINFDWTNISSRSINIFENKSMESIMMLLNLKLDRGTSRWLIK